MTAVKLSEEQTAENDFVLSSSQDEIRGQAITRVIWINWRKIHKKQLNPLVWLGEVFL